MTATEHIALFQRKLHVHRKVPGSPYSVEGCITVCIPCHGPLPRSRRGSRPVAKIPKSVLTDVRTLAAFHRQDANVFLTDLLEPILQKKMAEMSAEIARRTKQERKFHGRSPDTN
jgi:hypothetical protein